MSIFVFKQDSWLTFGIIERRLRWSKSECTNGKSIYFAKITDLRRSCSAWIWLKGKIVNVTNYTLEMTLKPTSHNVRRDRSKWRVFGESSAASDRKSVKCPKRLSWMQVWNSIVSHKRSWPSPPTCNIKFNSMTH